MFSATIVKKTLANNILCRSIIPQCISVAPVAATASLGRTYRSDNSAYGFKEAKLEQNEIEEVRFPKLQLLVDAYREFGHLEAETNLLANRPEMTIIKRLLDARVSEIEDKDVREQDLIPVFKELSTRKNIVEFLERTYCSSVGIEFTHLQNLEERRWLAEAFESSQGLKPSITQERKIALAILMLKCQAYDQFLATKFSSVKRYGGEGAETMMAFFDAAFSHAVANDLKQVVMCMPHRGRNNLLACMLNFPPALMFRKIRGKYEFPEEVKGSGDVLSHLCSSTDISYHGKSIHVTMIPNPSHLEANNPVAVGKTRARQQSLQEGDYSKNPNAKAGDEVICIQVHGDASFAGQGIVPETFSLAYCPHFRVGGSIHLIVNNQIGYTTEAERGRSSTYASDVAKMIGCPVLHVNAEYPEDLFRATNLAVDYRMRFRKDIVIDLICFRRWGHNELDDPTFTQPLMYDLIRNRQSLPDRYASSLISDGVTTKERLFQSVDEWQKFLGLELERADTFTVPQQHLNKQWSGLVQASTSITTWDTGVEIELLKFIGAKSVEFPSEFSVHERLLRFHVKDRLESVTMGVGIDWATAEALAVGSLLLQGFNVRISGQDVGRGTFSQRHAMLVDQKTDKIYIPLNHMIQDQNKFEVANSILSEEAVLGFEYGFSIENPKNFVIWEAQFGDFFNGAQTIIDTYVSSGESKWLLQSALTLLLPHGYDGMGPEHTSCRVERFLQLTDSDEAGIDGDDVNLQIANPTTPSQYFHLLRRQMVRNFRKPLVVMSPKMLLRHPACVSTLSEMSPGSHFHSVLGDDKVSDYRSVKRIIFVCGKHYYALDKEREAQNYKNVAIVRLEEISPFPITRLQEEVKRYPNAKEFVWAQEEQRNSGVWTFVAPRFENLVGVKLVYVGRGPLATPATAVGERHKIEAEEVVKEPFRIKL